MAPPKMTPGNLIKPGGGVVKPRQIATPLPPVVLPTKLDFVSGGRDADVSFEVEGMDLLVEFLLNAGPNVRQAVGYEMADIAHEIIEWSGAVFVPKDTMALYDSRDADEYDPKLDVDITQIGMWYAAPGSIKDPGGMHVVATDAKGNKGTYRQSVGHGGGMVLKRPEVYALDQHENMSYDHSPEHGKGGGGPKYLERPLNAKLPEIMPRLSGIAARVIGGEKLSSLIGMDVDVYAGTFGSQLGV